MACGCGKRTALHRIVSARSTYPSNGGYPLVSYPDCEALYPGDGPSAGSNVYVVDRGGEHEKLFKRNELSAASIYAREHNVTGFENLPTTVLCGDAVVAVYGA